MKLERLEKCERDYSWIHYINRTASLEQRKLFFYRHLSLAIRNLS